MAPTLACLPQHFLATRERRTRIEDSINIMASHVQPYQIQYTSVQALHDLAHAPSYITVMLQPYRSSRSLRYASMRFLTIPSAKLKKYDFRSFSFAAPTIWNSLPEPIRNHGDNSKFKTSIKTFLFKEHFN